MPGVKIMWRGQLFSQFPLLLHFGGWYLETTSNMEGKNSNLFPHNFVFRLGNWRIYNLSIPQFE